MTYRADPALDARLAALVEALPAQPAPPVDSLPGPMPYRTPRWVLVVVAIVLVIAAIVAFALVVGRPADAYRMRVPEGLKARMSPAQVVELARGALDTGAQWWPTGDAVPGIDIVSVVAAGRTGAVTWTVTACGPFVGMGHPAGGPDPHGASGSFTVDDSEGRIVGMGIRVGSRCDG